MTDTVVAALALRRGHFIYESGHHGDLWIDLDPLFSEPARTREWVRALTRQVAAWGVEVVCGPLTGGAFLAQLLALELGATFAFAERTVSAGGVVAYRIAGGQRALLGGKRTIVVDDAINAGSALLGTLDELDACGAHVVGVAALLTMGSAAATIAQARNIPIASLASIARNLWPASECPLCAQRVPVEDR